MADLRKTYKQRTLGFGNVEDGRIIRAVWRSERQKRKRSALFANNRNIDVLNSPCPSNYVDNKVEQPPTSKDVPEDRRTRLNRWKMQKALRKELEKHKKLPVFRTGIVAHKLDSPVFLHSDAAKPMIPTPPRRVTRATEKRLAAKLAGSQSARTPGPRKGPTKGSRKVKKKEGTKLEKSTPDENTPKGRSGATNGAKSKCTKLSFAPENYKFKGPEGLACVPLFGLAALEGTSIDPKNVFDAMSPYVAKTRSRTAILDGIKKTTPAIQASEDAANSKTSTIDVQKNVGIGIIKDKKTVERKKISREKRIAEEKSSEEEAIVDGEIPSAEIERSASENVPDDAKLGERKIEPAKRSEGEKGAVVKSERDAESSAKIGQGEPTAPSTPIETEERTAEYFFQITAKEVERLTSVCQYWSGIKSDSTVPEEAESSIDQAIGQTTLLVTKKMEQFKKLVADCESGNGLRVVTCEDLQGFWDMMYMQVRNCDSRFRKLDEAKERNWAPEPCLVVERAARRVVPRKKIISAKSSVRDLIRAARRAKLRSETTDTAAVVDLVAEEEDAKLTFDAGFFVVQSPRKTVTDPKSLRKSSLVPGRKSETNRRSSAGFYIMKVSQLCKDSESTNKTSNDDRTSGKGILNPNLLIAEPKSSQRDEQDIETEAIINFTKNLTFSEGPCNEDEEQGAGTNRRKSCSHASNDLTPSLRSSNRKTKADIGRESLSSTPVRSNETNVDTEMKTPANNKVLKIKSKSSKKENENPNTPAIEVHPRRSTRKSVRFTGEECTVCSHSKPVQPMTPHPRRSSKSIRKSSGQSAETSRSTEVDLISWETPMQLPERVRRSSRIASKCSDN